MNIGQIKLYDLFRKELHLTDDKAVAFVVAVADVIDGESDKQRDLLATKNDIHVLEDHIHQLDIKVEQSKSDLRKSIFLAGIIQFITIIGSLIAILKFMKF